jgi:hypothetical protein
LTAEGRFLGNRFSRFLFSIDHPFDVVDSIVERLDGIIFNATYRKFNFTSGVILTVRFSKNGDLTTIIIRRDQRVFKRLRVADTLHAVRIHIPSEWWDRMCLYLDSKEPKLLPRNWRFIEQENRLQTYYDGVEFSIGFDDLFEIRRIAQSI